MHQTLGHRQVRQDPRRETASGADTRLVGLPWDYQFDLAVDWNFRVLPRHRLSDPASRSAR